MGYILVTGSAGFIGSHVAKKLLERGDQVIGVDNLNDYYPVEYKESNVKDLEQFENFTFLKLDIENLSDLKKLFTDYKISRVAHLAARAGVRPSIADPFIYQQANTSGTLNLLEVSRTAEVENFVLTSSSSVYGNSKQVPFREDDSATDLAISPYAATKKATEVMGHTFHHLYGLNVNVVRPFTVYGPCGRPDMAPWLFTVAALQGKKIKKFGDGTSRRDYTFINDFVDGFVNAIDRVFGYEIFNLGNSQTVSLNEAIETISEVTGRPLQFDQLPMQPGDVFITNADISKAERLLDYKPQTSFRDGMKVFYDWIVEAHPELVTVQSQTAA